MPERTLIVDHLTLTYSGLFDLNAFYRYLMEWLSTNHFVPYEARNEELTTKNGKDIIIELLPYKKYTDHFKGIMKIEINFVGIKPVEVEKHETKVKLNKGFVKIVIDGYLETEYEKYWERRATLFFFKLLFDKLFFKRYTLMYENAIKQDVYKLYDALQHFFNLYK
ncbi:hypothetical protein DRJ16_02240 [Candidatus Woesearchaeota archaeon]|nr:MAG: hypothetical protein DRJ16_02240 [Candidatus Woesearchaeota archaeon]